MLTLFIKYERGNTMKESNIIMEEIRVDNNHTIEPQIGPGVGCGGVCGGAGCGGGSLGLGCGAGSGGAGGGMWINLLNTNRK